MALWWLCGGSVVALWWVCSGFVIASGGSVMVLLCHYGVYVAALWLCSGSVMNLWWIGVALWWLCVSVFSSLMAQWWLVMN